MSEVTDLENEPNLCKLLSYPYPDPGVGVGAQDTTFTKHSMCRCGVDATLKSFSEDALNSCPEDPLLWIQGTPFYQLLWCLFHGSTYKAATGARKEALCALYSRNSPRLTCLLPELVSNLPAAEANIKAWYGIIPLVAGRGKNKDKDLLPGL